MGLYYLPVLIRNDRYFVARLDSDFVGANREEVDFNFVIYAKDRTSTSVLSIENCKNAVFNQMKANSPLQDIHLNECEISLLKHGPNSFELLLKNKGNFKLHEFNDPDTGLHLTYLNSEERIFLNYWNDKVKQQAISLHVTLEYSETEKYSSRFFFAIVRSKECNRVVIDFGSEASQIGYQNCDIISGISYYDILGNIVNKLNSEGRNYQRRDFLNNEEGDQFLYKSFYAIKKSMSHDDKENFLFNFTNDIVNDNIRLFITRGEVAAINQTGGSSFREKYVIIPNLKLGIDKVTLPLSFDNKPEDYSISTHKKELISAILLRLLRLMISTKSDFTKGGIITTLLVPNMYTQGDIFSLLDELRKQTDKMIRSLGIPDGMLYIEYETISESDAAFMGYQLSHSSKIHLNNGDISLIIDCGKGTTDISMVLADGNQNFSSFFRTGFAGAGNVLTYAFTEDFLTLVLRTVPGNNEISVNEFIKKQILEQNLTKDVLDFLQFMERQKKKSSGLQILPLKEFTELKEQSENTERQVNNLHKDPSNLLQYSSDIFENKNKIWDTEITGIINKAVSCISHCIITSIKDAITDDIKKRIKFVMLTGRAFYYENLKRTLIEDLKELLGSSMRVHTLNPQHAINNKNVAIFGAFSGAYKITDFTGIPIDRKEGLTKNKDLFNNNSYLFDGIKIQPDNDIIYNTSIIRRNHHALRPFRHKTIDIYFTRDEVFIRRMENQKVKHVISLDTLVTSFTGGYLPIQDLKRISMFPAINDEINTIDNVYTAIEDIKANEQNGVEEKRTLWARLFN